MQINKILRYALLVGIFIIPFIPFVVSSAMFFPFITGKNFLFRILVELLLGGWAILALFDKAYRPRFSWLLISVLSFVGIIAFADIFGANPFKSFWSNFERMEGLLTLIHLAGYFVVAGVMLNTEKLWIWFWNTTVAVSAIIGIYGIIQLAGKIAINQGGVRLDATFGNAAYLAIYMLFHIFITTFLLVRLLADRQSNSASWVKYLYGAAIILQFVILYYTATRGAFLGLVGGVFLTTLLIAIFEKERKIIRKISVSILIAVIAFVGIFFIIKNTEFIKKSDTLGRISSISLKEGATRFTIWGMALQGVKERPLLGWGQENFNLVFNKYYKPSLYGQEQWFDRVHNIFFDWLIAGGILGFLAYFSIPILMLYYLWRRLETKLSVTEKSIFTGMLAGYFFHNIFVFDNIVSYIMFFSVAAYIYSHSTLFRSDLNSNNSKKQIAVVLVILAVISSIYFFNIKGIITARALIGGISPQKEGIDANIANFKRAVSYGVVGKQEVVEQMASTAINVKNQGADIDIQTKFFEMANGEMKSLVEDAPDDARLRVFYGSLLSQFNLYNDALPHLEKAVELSPDKQTIRFELGSAYLNLGDVDKAYNLFKETYELNTNFKQAEIIYRVGAIYANKTKEADSLIGPISDTDRTDTRIVNAYAKSNMWDEVIKSWNIAIENDPNNVQLHLSLGASYLQVGRRQDAINEIQKAVDLDPNFKDQGEFYIKEIRAGRNP